MNLSFNLARRQQELRSGAAGVDLFDLADDVVDGFRIGIDRLPADVREERVEADFFAPSELLDCEPSPPSRCSPRAVHGQAEAGNLKRNGRLPKELIKEKSLWSPKKIN